MIKTKKSYTKRLRATKSGALKMRTKNQCHFNARERNPRKMAKKKMQELLLSMKDRSRFLPFLKKSA